MLPPFDLPEGILVLITDQLHSPADFLLQRSLIGHIKTSKTSKSVILSVSEGIARWKAIAAKSNVNLAEHISSGLLDFMDVLSYVRPPEPSDKASPTLRPLLDQISSTIEPSSTPTLIILDDVTSLEWIGFSFLDIARFTRALRALCLKVNATLVIRHHNVTPDEPDDLFRHLLQLCTYHMDVCPLASGRSGTVSGEVALHPGLGTPPSKVRLIPRSSALQYRLTDSGAVFFERGTSEVVL